MAAVLGLSGGFHDAAAALVVDGQLVAAQQEERLSRRKNDPSLPFRAARAVLELGGLSVEDLDAVVFHEDPYARLERVLVEGLRALPRGFRHWPAMLRSQVGTRLWVLDALAEGLGLPRGRLTYRSHHESHAASAFFCSPYPRAAVLTVDGVGEAVTTGLWLGEGDSLRLLSSLDFPHSIGLLYAAITAWLGFTVNEGEYKVMGLAAFGRPDRRRADLGRLVQQDPSDGSFRLEPRYFADFLDPALGFGPDLEALLGPRRPLGRPWDLSTAEDRAYADVAAALQALTEELLLGLARQLKRLTGADALCLAGGVALNAVANRRLQQEAGFSRVFVQPAAGDAGAALGAALLGAMELGDPRPPPLGRVALGVEAGVARTVQVATELGLSVAYPQDPHAFLAERIAAGGIVGLVTGRCEWGPRALGQRALLCDPADPAQRERLNRVVKQREPFRPFAPAIRAQDCAAWFGEPPDDLTPYMTTVRTVSSDRIAQLGAVTHADGTARVQTVAPEAAGALHAVLDALCHGGAAPVVLETSLNGRGEPMVGTGVDALGFLLSHDIDGMLVGEAWISRRPGHRKEGAE